MIEQSDKETEIAIRKELKKHFPDTVFQVTFCNGEYDVITVGGKTRYEEYTSLELEEILDEIIVLATFGIEYEMENNEKNSGH